MTEPTSISDLWTAYQAADAAWRPAYERERLAEQRYGVADIGYRHTKVVIAAAIADELEARRRYARRAILAHQVSCPADMKVLRALARETPGWSDVRAALKAGREALAA